MHQEYDGRSLSADAKKKLKKLIKDAQKVPETPVRKEPAS